jgi:hypothetical protein
MRQSIPPLAAHIHRGAWLRDIERRTQLGERLQEFRPQDVGCDWMYVIGLRATLKFGETRGTVEGAQAAQSSDDPQHAVTDVGDVFKNRILRLSPTGEPIPARSIPGTERTKPRCGLSSLQDESGERDAWRYECRVQQDRSSTRGQPR